MLKDILEESWAYQEMMEEAQKKAVEKELRETLLHIVQRKYPQLEPLATQYVNQVKEPEQLSSLIDRLFDAQNSEEVAQLFTQQ